MSKTSVSVTVVRGVSFSIELDDSLSVEEKQSLILEQADEMCFDDMIIHECDDDDLIM